MTVEQALAELLGATTQICPSNQGVCVLAFRRVNTIRYEATVNLGKRTIYSGLQVTPKEAFEIAVQKLRKHAINKGKRQ